MVGCTSGGSGPASSSAHLTFSVVSPSVSASPTRTGPLTTGPGVKPGEVPPVVDSTASAHDDRGALLSAIYFIRVVDWSVATTDPTLIAPISLSTCKTCAGYISKLEKLSTEGGYLTDGRITVMGAEVVTGTSNITADKVIELHIVQQDDVVHRPAAAPSTEGPSSLSSVIRVYLSWLGGTWKVVELGTTK
jgi:hypothetical protein